MNLVILVQKEFREVRGILSRNSRDQRYCAANRAASPPSALQEPPSRRNVFAKVGDEAIREWSVDGRHTGHKGKLRAVGPTFPQPCSLCEQAA